MAIESRKQAARRPRPAVTQTRIGLLLQQLEPIELLLLDGFFREVIKKKVRNIVGERAADEKFHREIVNALRILALIGFLGMHPSLRKNVAHGAGDGLKTLARADRRYFHDVVKDEVPLVERVVRSRKLNWPAAVLLVEELRSFVKGIRCSRKRIFFVLCFHTFIPF